MTPATIPRPQISEPTTPGTPGVTNRHAVDPPETGAGALGHQRVRVAEAMPSAATTRSASTWVVVPAASVVVTRARREAVPGSVTVAVVRRCRAPAGSASA